MIFERNLAAAGETTGESFLLIKKDVEKRSDKGMVECH